jgi:hypothetical protein
MSGFMIGERLILFGSTNVTMTDFWTQAFYEQVHFLPYISEYVMISCMKTIGYIVL